MKDIKTRAGMILASLLGWLLLLPPFSVSPAGKTYVNTKAPLANWEAFSKHQSAAECQKHRDDLRAQLDKATAPGKSKKKEVFVTLKERAAAAVCIASEDPRLRPAATPTTAPPAASSTHR